jgi:hypothetical protein
VASAPFPDHDPNAPLRDAARRLHLTDDQYQQWEAGLQRVASRVLGAAQRAGLAGKTGVALGGNNALLANGLDGFGSREIELVTDLARCKTEDLRNLLQVVDTALVDGRERPIRLDERGLKTILPSTEFTKDRKWAVRLPVGPGGGREWGFVTVSNGPRTGRPDAGEEGWPKRLLMPKDVAGMRMWDFAVRTLPGDCRDAVRLLQRSPWSAAELVTFAERLDRAVVQTISVGAVRQGPGLSRDAFRIGVLRVATMPDHMFEGVVPLEEIPALQSRVAEFAQELGRMSPPDREQQSEREAPARDIRFSLAVWSSAGRDAGQPGDAARRTPPGTGRPEATSRRAPGSTAVRPGTPGAAR